MRKLIPALLMIASLVWVARKVQASTQARIEPGVNQLAPYKI